MSKPGIRYQYHLALAWLVVILAVMAILGWQFHQGQVRVQTDLLRLLPAAELPASANAALQQAETSTVDQFTLYLRGADAAQIAEAAQQVQQQVESSTHVASLNFQRLNSQAELLKSLKIGRYQLLSPTAQTALRTADSASADAVVDRAIRRVYQPLGSNPLATFDEDPLGLFADYLQALPQASLPDGWRVKPQGQVPVVEHAEFSAEQRYSVVLYGQLAGQPYQPDVQDELEVTLNAAQAALPDGYQLVHSGAVFHIAVATRQARSEMSTIGVGSLVGIVLLLGIAFLAFRPIVLSILGIGVGVLCASVVTLAIFGEIHALTLVFGASLTGMSIDYAFHYFAAPEVEDHNNRLQQVMPGITIGVVTSVIAFLCLLLAPFPGLQQMAVFAAVGLTAAYLCVVCWYPVVSRGLREPNQRLLAISGYLSSGPQRLWHGLVRQRVLASTVLLVLLGLLVGGLYQLSPNDDIRLLYQPSGELADMERQAQTLQRERIDRRMLLLGAADGEALQRLEAQVRVQLTTLQAQGDLQGFLSLGAYLPPAQEQQENYALWQQAYAPGGLLEQFAERLSLGSEWLADQREQLRQAANDGLDPAMLAGQYPDEFGRFWIEPILSEASDVATNAEQIFTLVALLDIQDATQLQSLAEAMPGVYYIDRIEMTSAAFKKYRSISLWFTALAYALILLLLFARYRWQLALRVFAGPCIAAVVTMAVLGWAGVTVNLFTSFALIVVLGVGIDYAVFFAESGRQSKHTMLAVGLSATTTVLAFGLLALSDTMALHTFGLTLWIGITLAFVLAPAFAPAAPPKTLAKT